MIPPKKQNAFLTRKMRIWDPLGGHQEFSILIFWRVIKHPTFLLFVGLTLILFFATDPLEPDLKLIE